MGYPHKNPITPTYIRLPYFLKYLMIDFDNPLNIRTLVKRINGKSDGITESRNIPIVFIIDM